METKSVGFSTVGLQIKKLFVNIHRLLLAKTHEAFSDLQPTLPLTSKIPLSEYQRIFDDQITKFDLWAGNIGLLNTGHASLDYRLMGAVDIIEFVDYLFQYLIFSLHQIQLIISGSRNPFELGDDSISDSDASDSDSDSDDDDDDPQSELLSRLSEITNTIKKLLRLATKIRNPTIKFVTRKGSTFQSVDPETQCDLFSEFQIVDERYVKDVFHSLREESRAKGTLKASSIDYDECLISRMAKANTLRRREFAYLVSHERKREEDSKQLSQITNHQVVPTSFAGQQLAQTLHTVPTTATELDPTGINLQETESVFSTSTIGSLISQLRTNEPGKSTKQVKAIEPEDVEFPPPPCQLLIDEFFRCPICFTICSAKYLNSKVWRAHIVRDLRPYVCIFKKCKNSNELYHSKVEWVTHMEQHHRYEESLDTNEDTHCPICLLESPQGPALDRHIASHMERVALFSLPRHRLNYDDQDESDYFERQKNENESTNSSKYNAADLESRTRDFSVASGVWPFSSDQDRIEEHSQDPTKRTEDRNELESLETRQLECSEKVETLGAEHPETIASMERLAINYSVRAQFGQAAIVQESVLSLNKKVFGLEHSRAVVSMGNLARIYWGQDRYEEATKLMEQALALRQNTLGRSHSLTIMYMEILAGMYSLHGRHKEAAELQEEAHNFHQETEGPSHAKTITSMENLARIYCRQDRYEEATRLMEQALALRQNTLGRSHSLTIMCMEILARTYSLQGRHKEAAELQEEVHLFHQATDGPSRIYTHQNRPKDARELEKVFSNIVKNFIDPKQSEGN